MDMLELAGQLQVANGWSRTDKKWLRTLPFWVALRNAAQDLGEDDFEKAASAEYPGELTDFCFALANFIRANVDTYSMPESTLTGTLPDGAESA